MSWAVLGGVLGIKSVPLMGRVVQGMDHSRRHNHNGGEGNCAQNCIG